MRAMFVLLFIFSLNFIGLAERIKLEDFKEDPERPYFSLYSKNIEIGNGISFNVTGEITSHGNGCIRIANLSLLIYRVGYNVVTYENGLLDVDLIDLDGDGCKDIIISGTLLYNDEKNDVLILRREPIVFIYMFEPKRKEFYCSYRNASFAMDFDWYSDIGDLNRIDSFIKAKRKKAQDENEAMSRQPRAAR